MKARLSLTISIAATMLWSCQFDDVLSTPSDGGVIRVTSSLTKAESTGGTNESTTNDNFKDNEIIYVWASKTGGSSTDDYIKAWQLTAKDDKGNFTGDSKAWPYDGKSLDFHALHGNFTESDLNNKKWSELTSLKHTVLPDQSSDDNRRKSDLLYAEKPGATHGNNVALSFSHLLAKITVKLDLKNSMGITKEDFVNASVSILGIQQEAYFNYLSQTAPTSGGDAINIKAGTIPQPDNMDSETYYAGSAIVPLQTINADQSLIKIILKNNRTFIYKASANTEFQKGQEYTYTLTIRGQQITGSLSVSQFDTADKSISFKDYSDYFADLKNRAYLGSAAAPHDLSYDYNGQINTANCYVVTHPGYYKIPLVYGNAIKNGATNAIAYGVDENGSRVSTTFVNHLGAPITDPYIYNNINSNGDNLSAGSAELVWQDAPNLISNNIALCDDNKYIKFEITKENIEQGNAVIAVKNTDGTTMWSWHIWVTNKNVYETIPVRNATDKTNNFMPVPLGWDDDIPNQPNCPYYQWGRKDPFVGSTGSGNTTKTWYDASGNTKNTNPETTSTRTKAESIKNPEKFISGYSTWDTSTTYDNWNANVTSQPTSPHNDNAVEKTVYDPSPVGFKMPTSNTYTGFGNGVSETEPVYEGIWDAGFKFTTGLPEPSYIYMRANGFRSCSDGSLDHEGVGGYYWTSSPYSNDIYACCLRYYSYQVNSKFYDGCAYGFSICPVSE